MEVLIHRVAGLDVGERRWRYAGARRGPCAHVQANDGIAAGDAGLAARVRGDDPGDRVDLDVLEGAVLLP